MSKFVKKTVTLKIFSPSPLGCATVELKTLVRQLTTLPLLKVNNFNVRWFLVVSDQALWSVVIKKSVAAYNLQLQLNTALEISGDVSYT